jgi:ABC-type bacteriocin/lantibiotic exporter with double-glycine peptidase domain
MRLLRVLSSSLERLSVTVGRKRRFRATYVARVLAYLQEDRWRFIGLGMVILTVAIPLTLLEPFLIRKATRLILGGKGLGGLFTVIGMVLAYYGGRLLMELALNYVGLRLSYRIHVRVLRDAFGNFLGKDLSLVKALPRGDVLYCLFNDTMRVAGFASSDLIGLFSNIVLLIACCGLMLYFDAGLALPSIGFLLATAVLHVRFSGVLLKKQLEAKGIDQELSGRAQNMLSGIVTLKSFRLLWPILDKWLEKYRPRWVIEIAIRMIELALTSVATHAHIMFTFVILFLGLGRVESISTSLGQVFAFLVVYNRMAQPLQYLAAFYLGFQETSAAITRHYRLYDLKSKTASVQKPGKLATPPGPLTPVQLLELSDATTIRGNQEVRIPELRFRAGQAYLLEGPNGAGKTTTGLALAGLIPITTGDYRLNGSPTVAPYEACRIVYLEKEGYWPEGTIAENCRLSDLSGVVDEARLEHCLEMCKCNDLVASLPLRIHNPIATDWNLLSDGESQRLFLAFAMYHEPGVLILDEALTHIPFETRQEIVENIRIARPDLILILISHHAHDQELVDQVIRFPKRVNRGTRVVGQT